MIHCNLAILLAEKNLKITKISNDTGISRTTLTALSNNNSQGIQFDTLNKLCTYLNISPNDLINHIPVEIKVIDAQIVDSDTVTTPDDTNYCLIEFELEQNGQVSMHQLKCPAFIYSTKGKTAHSISILVDTGLSDALTPNTYFLEILSRIPRPFLTDIEKSIALKLFSSGYGLSLGLDSISVNWKN